MPYVTVISPQVSVTTCIVCYILYCLLHLVLCVTACTVGYNLYCLLHLYCPLQLVLSVACCTVCYILYCLSRLVLSVTTCAVTHRRLKMMVCLYNVSNVNVVTFRSAVSGHNPGLLKRGKVSTYYCVTDDTFLIFDFWNTIGESSGSHLPCCKLGRCFHG